MIYNKQIGNCVFDDIARGELCGAGFDIAGGRFGIAGGRFGIAGGRFGIAGGGFDMTVRGLYAGGFDAAGCGLYEPFAGDYNGPSTGHTCIYC